MGYTPNTWRPMDVITSKKLNDLEQGLTQTSDNVVYGMGGATQSSDGIHSLTYINKGDALPNNPQVGDTIFMKDGDDFSILEWDGEQWNTRVDPKLSDRIQTALDEAKDNAQTLINNNNTSINEMIDQVTKDKIAAALADADFNAQAQEMADKALADAKANTATVAQDTLNSANNNIADAKKSLTDDLNKEISDRTEAVSDLDTTAQGYANQAKTDAINVATAADGVINKKIDDTTSSITTTINQNKSDADGKITTAQSTATQALNQVSTKVSQTDYDKKTGQLQTDLTSTTQTANKATTDIVSIQQKDNTQDARMTQIESDASGVKTTVSNLQTAQGKQAGDISTLQQRADGFDATVTKINTTVNSLGQINQLFNTEFSPDFSGWYTNTNANPTDVVTTQLTPIGTDGFGSNVVSHKGGGNWINSAPISVTAGMVLSFSSRLSVPKTVTSGTPIALYIMAYDATNARVLSQGYNIPINQLTATPTTFKIENIVMPSGAVKAFAIYAWNVADEVYISQPMLVFSDHVGTYVQGNYNNNSATAKAQLTADQATLSINNYKTDADGRISKAQADIVTNANAITQKVSQTDYNAKTGDLDTRVTKAQQTADGAVTTVGNYQTSNDARVKAAETKISQNANDITLRATTTDLNNAKADYNAQIAQVKVDAGKVETTVSNLTSTVNDLSQVNLINNSDFSPDLGGWTKNNNGANGNYTTGDYDYAGGVYVLESTTTGMARTNSAPIPINSLSNVSFSFNFYIFNLPSGGSIYNQLTYLDVNFNEINGSGYPGGINLASGNATGKWINRTVNNLSFTPPTNAKYLVFSFDVRGNGTKAGFNRPILVKGATVGNYVRGQYNNNDKIASQQVTIDGITDTVSKQGTNIDSVTSRVTSAEGTLTTATNNITGLQTKQTTTANQVTQEIADRKTGDINTLQSSKDFTTSNITSAVNGVNSTITQTASGILAQVEATNMVVNSEFDPLNGTWYQLVGSGAVNSTVGAAWSPTSTLSFSDWAVVDGSTLLTYAVGTWFTTALAPAGAGRAYSASIVAGRPSAVTTSTALDLRIGFWDANKKLLSNASSGNIIDGTAYKGIDKYKVENKVAPANTKYVSIIIAHSSASATDIIGRPMLNNGATVSPYVATFGNTSSSTILSLFKDNWSIGIKDNQGLLTSGLFGDINGMTLNGKVVTIDANTTNITGKTWINSAMIANAAIQTVNIADAAITNAKIATLDVAKITGDVSNFIQSNWNGQFGSTTIDSTGMEVVTGKAKTKFGDGSMSLISAAGENIGWIGRQVDSVYSNLDFLTIGLNGWQTTAPGDEHYDKDPNNPDAFYGGDGIIFGISTVGGGYLPLMMYNTPLAASYRSGIAGWMYTQPIVGGIDIYGDNMKANNTVSWRFTNLNTRGFTYPFLTSQQADVAGAKTGIILGSGTMYFYGGNNAVMSIRQNGYGYYDAQKFGSGGSALYMAGDGALIAHSSATKYKTNIDRNVDIALSEKLLTIDLASWSDKEEERQLKEYNETGKPTDYAIDMDGAKYYGLIAEDLVKANLEEFVVRNTVDGSVDSIQYDKIGVAWIPLVRDLRNQVNELKFEIEKIKEGMK